MISQRIANLIFAAIVLVVTGYMAWLAWGFETPPLGGATLPTKFFPLVLLGFITLCVMIYAIEYILRGQSGGDGGTALSQSWAQARRGLFTLVIVLALFWFWRDGNDAIKALTGFDLTSLVPTWAIAGVLIGPLVAFSMGARVWWHFVLIVALSVLIYIAFAFGLGTQFK